MTPFLPPIPKALTAAELADHVPPSTTWLWEPYLLAGGITLLTSQWKSGKTTLVSVVLAATRAGGTVAGSPVRAGRAGVVSEEPPDVWARRNAALGFGDNVRWLCRPFRGQPGFAEWTALVQLLGDDPADLVVIDPLAAVLPPGTENNVAAAHAALAPLHDLTDRGAAVLLLHHPKKSAGETMSPRGTGALTAYADVLAELDRPPGDANLRRRRLRSTSRVAGPELRVIELDAAGAAYSVVDPDAAAKDDYDAELPILMSIFEDASYRMTRRAVHKAWPQDYDPPSERTLLRWLERAEAQGLLERRGRGRRFSPFLYAKVGHRNLLPDLPPLGPMDNADLLNPAPLTEAERKEREAASYELILACDARFNAMQNLSELQRRANGRKSPYEGG